MGVPFASTVAKIARGVNKNIDPVTNALEKTRDVAEVFSGQQPAENLAGIIRRR